MVAHSDVIRSSVDPHTVDPWTRVMGLGARNSLFATVLVASLGMHGLLAAGGGALAVLDAFSSWSSRIHADVKSRLLGTYEVELKEDPPPPPPEEPKPELKPEDKAQPQQAPPQAPPPLAQAGKVLAAEPDPNAKNEDLPTFNQGNGDEYKGGLTSPTGTGTTAAPPNAAPSGIAGGTGTAFVPPTPPPVDRSRGARALSQGNWQCPFPNEADGVDDARAVVEVDVSPDGKPLSVRVLTDPGYGFGREAARCAMRERYQGALDKEGNPVAGRARVGVTFSR